MAITLNGCKIYGITQNAIDIVKANYHLKAKDIEKQFNIPARRVAEIIKALNLRTKYVRTNIAQSDIQQYTNDLKNPFLSHVKIAKKYNTTPDCVMQMRKRKGWGVRRTNSNTLIEEKIQNILDKNDIAYLVQKRIDKWSIDFYLGHHICLDVHGTWAHSKPNVQDRDKRKEKFLTENNYYYLVISESELVDINTVELKILDFFWVSLNRNIKLKNR